MGRDACPVGVYPHLQGLTAQKLSDSLWSGLLWRLIPTAGLNQPLAIAGQQPPWGTRGRAESSNALMSPLVFLVTRHALKGLAKSGHMGTKDIPVTQEIARNQASVPGTVAETKSVFLSRVLFPSFPRTSIFCL